MQQNNGIGRRQTISFLVFSVILMGLMFYFQPKQQPSENIDVNSVESTEISQNIPLDKISTYDGIDGKIEKIQLKNDLLTVDFSTLGGQISSVRLNNFSAFDIESKNKELFLFSNDNADYGFQFKDRAGNLINTRNLIFHATSLGNEINMHARIGDAKIEFVYVLQDNYNIDFKVRTQGLSQVISTSKADFIWNYKVREIEKGRSQEQTHTEFVYSFNNYKNYDYDARGKMDESKEVLNWIGVKQQFFTAVIEAQTGFKNSTGNQETITEGEYLKDFHFEGQVDLIASELNQDFTWYFMPLDLNLLKSFNKNFDEILPFGWSFIGSLNRWFFIPIYNMLSSWGISAGWVIFLLTITVKIVLSPIMYKQHKLSAMMKVIRPEIEEVQAKHKNSDPMKKQQAVMGVYRKAGVNQFAGCIPGLVQIPIFYALFRFFPNMLDLRGRSFWFVEDLTAYDDIIKLPFNIPLLGDHISIFALACTVVVLIYTLMTTGNMQQPTQEGMPNMKPMMYIFPIVFMFFLNSAASGLSWYYFISNAINILIILIIKHFILNESKIHAQIQENKSKPKKEGRFQARMREMMEQAQEKQKQIDKTKKK